MTTTELKRCPFCGGEVRLSIYEALYSITCTECSIHTGGYVNKEIAKKRWNTRVGDSINPESCLILKDCHKCGGELTYFDAEGYCHKCKQPR